MVRRRELRRELRLTERTERTATAGLVDTLPIRPAIEGLLPKRKGPPWSGGPFVAYTSLRFVMLSLAFAANVN